MSHCVHDNLCKKRFLTDTQWHSCRLNCSSHKGNPFPPCDNCYNSFFFFLLLFTVRVRLHSTSLSVITSCSASFRSVFVRVSVFHFRCLGNVLIFSLALVQPPAVSGVCCEIRRKVCTEASLKLLTVRLNSSWCYRLNLATKEPCFKNIYIYSTGNSSVYSVRIWVGSIKCQMEPGMIFYTVVFNCLYFEFSICILRQKSRFLLS